MEQYIKKLFERMKNSPDKIALVSERRQKGLSYRSLDDNSGKVYSWLKKNGYGKEDIILICLPRGMRTVVAMIGVLKAGAAFTVVESTYAPERIDFIKKDCECKLVINEDIFEEMMDSPYLDGYENSNPHDAAFVVYTSGSTGTPKGALHEYGELVKNYHSLCVNGRSVADENSRFALLAPLNFVASICAILGALVLGCELFIVPYLIVKDTNKLYAFFETNNINLVFMAPSLLRAMKTIPSTIKDIVLGSEPANGVYMEGVNIYNFYGMSESGFFIASCQLEKAYDIAPIGKPQFELTVKILDENGLEVKQGEEGELCFENDYFRGYVNLEEKNKKAFRNGLFCSNDIAKIDENGNIVILGRNDDMIKINGNRIEPAEIETAVSNILHIGKVIAKGSASKTGSYIAVYYLKSEGIKSDYADKTGLLNIDINAINEKLLNKLPYYMLPSYYIGLDSFPMNANGKISKKDLPIPEINPKNEYVAPRNEIEEKICNAISKVLQCKVGINDDFYQCGGDSLSSISFLSECNLTGLSIGDLFKCRTAAKLAAHYQSIQSEAKTIDEINDRSFKEKQPLLVEQLTMLDFQFLQGKSTMWNLSCLFKLREAVNLDRLKEAIKKTIYSHPVFLTIIETNEDGDFVQYYDETVFEEIEIINTSEEKLNEIKPNLIKVMKLLRNRLYQCTIYKTEKDAYLFLDVHHIITDGTSLKVFRNDLVNFYKNDEYKPPKDYYYYALYENATFSQTNKYREALEYYKQFNDSEYRGGIAFDFHEKGFHMGYYSKITDITNEEFEKSTLCKNIGKNGLFAIATAIAEKIYNNADKVQVNWLNSGRDNAFKLNICGLMYKVTRLYFDFNKYSNLNEMYDDLKYQLNATIAYGLYPRTFQRWEAGEENIGIFYQRGIYDLGEFAELVREEVELPTPENASDAAFDIEMIDSYEGTELRAQYSSSNYKEDTIKTVIAYIEKAMELLIKYENRLDMSAISLIEKIRERN